MSNQVKVGIFSTVSVVIFVLGFYFLKGTNLFVRKNVYYAVYDRVDGLYKSNPIDINGFPVGKVGDMERDPLTGKIVVELDLDKNIQIPKSDSTRADLVSTDFLGSKKVRLVFGSSSTFYEEGDTIHTFFKQDLTEQIGAQIDPIMGDVRHMLPQLDTTITGIKLLFDERNPKGIYTTLDGINTAIGQINVILAQNQQTLKLTLNNLQSITGNIEKNNDAITAILKNAQNVTDSLQQANLKQTVANLNNAISQLNGVLKDVNEGKGTLGKIVKDDELYSKVDTAVNNLNVLLKDVKARPYRYISINVFGAKKAEERRAQKYDETGK
ncbi:MAG TPA: MlaD family protein [Chitinophagales bacterium]|nr:MlaD family protein [Chitinophagales bacterium]